MNCKPGDLAMVVARNPLYQGRLVEVMYAAPKERFQLPDGYHAQGAERDDSWVVRFIGVAVEAPVKFGGTRLTHFCVGQDHGLKPLRDVDDKTIRKFIKETA